MSHLSPNTQKLHISCCLIIDVEHAHIYGVNTIEDQTSQYCLKTWKGICEFLPVFQTSEVTCNKQFALELKVIRDAYESYAYDMRFLKFIQLLSSDKVYL